MVRTAVLATCILGLFAMAQAQPMSSVHQPKQAKTVSTAATPAAVNKDAKDLQPRQMAATSTLDKTYCSPGLHYFSGYDRCIHPTPWQLAKADSKH